MTQQPEPLARRKGPCLESTDCQGRHHKNCPCNGTGEIYLNPTLLERCQPPKEDAPCIDGSIFVDGPGWIPHQDCHGTGYVDVTTVEKLWAVAGASSLRFKMVCEIIIGDLEKAHQFLRYWFGELTEPERIQALETAIEEARG